MGEGEGRLAVGEDVSLSWWGEAGEEVGEEEVGEVEVGEVEVGESG